LTRLRADGPLWGVGLFPPAGPQFCGLTVIRMETVRKTV
jgi:hypothetical protein